MNKTALHIGEPAGNWPGNAQLYLLSQPHHEHHRVIVWTIQVPDPKDPDAAKTETLISGEDGYAIHGTYNQDHRTALRGIGYELVSAGSDTIVGLVRAYHSTAGGSAPSEQGFPSWEQETLNVAAVDESVAAYRVAVANGDFDGVGAGLARIVVDAVRAALTYGLSLDVLVRKQTGAVNVG